MVIISDPDTLINDLQTLLSHPHTTPTITVSNGVLSLPRQLLSVRNVYFRKLLSRQWYHTNLTKPNTSTQVFQDLLEFLITGCVTLSSHPSAIPHNLNLAFLANEVLSSQLEDIVITHISNLLSCHNINVYLNGLHLPSLQSLDKVLTSFLKSNTPILKTLPRSLQTVSNVCQLLSSTQLPSAVYPDLARYIKSSTTLTILRQNTALKDCILTIPTPTFIRYFEDLDLFTTSQLLQKYRHEALSTPVNPPLKHPKTRLLYESKHPHETYRLEQTITHVTLPQGTHAHLVFHELSALGEHAVLAFFTQDPALGAQPYKSLVGSFEKSFIIPSHSFWFACYYHDGVCGWGWRFFVQPCSPRAHDTEMRGT